MKKEVKFVIIALIIVVILAGALVGIVYAVNRRDNPPVKLERIVVSVRNEKVVLTSDNATEDEIRSQVTVVAKYTDGSSEYIKDYLILNFNPETIGEQLITFEYKGKKANLLIETIIPEPPLTEDDVIGTYQAAFYSSDASIEIMKSKTFSLNTGDRTITGSYVINDINTLTLKMNNHELKVVIDRENNKLTWFNIVDGVTFKRNYVHIAEDGTRYRLSLYEKQIVKWDISKNGGSYQLVAFGGYYYDEYGVFVAYCFDQEYEIELDEESATFRLKRDEPIDGVKVYTLEQKTDDFIFKYVLTVSSEEYTLKVDRMQDDKLLESNTYVGQYKLDSNILTLLNDAENRKAILNDENGTFEFALILFSDLHTSSKKMTFRLTLIDKGKNYQYKVEDVTVMVDAKELRSGIIAKADLVDGFQDIGAEEDNFWIYYKANETFVVTNYLAGTYYLSTDSSIVLRISQAGSYSITYSRNEIEDDYYTIVNGRVVIHDKFVNLEGNRYSFDTDNALKMESNLPTRFLLNEAIDFHSAWLSIDTVSGNRIFVYLDDPDVKIDYFASDGTPVDLPTVKSGRFIAIIKYETYLYRHVYDVFDEEIEIALSVNNFPKIIQRYAGNSVLDNIIVMAITNLGNEIQVDRSFVSIENFQTDEVGTFVCTIRYADLSLEVTYEVTAEQVEEYITLHGEHSLYNQNDPINLEGTYILVHYNYGNDTKVQVTEDMVSDFTTAVKGMFVAKVSYHEFTVNYIYEVRPVFDIKSIKLNEWFELTASSEEDYNNMAKVSFTPASSGEYTFISDSFYDSYGYLYNENLEKLAEDDDSGGNLNFKITCYLEAGKTYILAMKVSTVDGKIRILVTDGNYEEGGDENENDNNFDDDYLDLDLPMETALGLDNERKIEVNSLFVALSKEEVVETYSLTSKRSKISKKLNG